MASTGLLSGVNPYSGGGDIAVDITSKPLQYVLMEKAKQDAKAEAIDKYYKDYEKSLNTAGLTPEEVKIFTQKLNEVKGYGIKNKDQINYPSKYGYDAQSTLDAGFRNLSNYLGEAKQAAGERKAFKSLHDSQIAQGKHVSGNYLDVWHNAMLPVGGGYVAPDISQIKYFDPFNDAKFTKNVTYGVKPMEKIEEETIYSPTKIDTGFNKKTKYHILPITEAQKLGDQGGAEFETSDGAREFFNTLYQDKKLVNNLNQRFGQVYKTIDPTTGKEVVPQIQTVKDFAKAYAISKMPEKAILASENILNNEGKFREWKRKDNITGERSTANSNKILKALELQGDQEIFNNAMNEYRTNTKFEDNPTITKVNFPKEIQDKYPQTENSSSEAIENIGTLLLEGSIEQA
jgi:hypothetical protein